MDQRLLALADVINSAAPVGAQAVLKYTLKSIPGSPLPPGKKLLPYIKLKKNYEGTWRRATRKVRIVNMLRRMGRERMKRRRESDDSFDQIHVGEHGYSMRRRSSIKMDGKSSQFMVEHLLHKASMQRRSIRSQKPPPYAKSSDTDVLSSSEVNAGPSTSRHPVDKAVHLSKDNVKTGKTNVEKKRVRQISVASNNTDEHGMKTIAIQTDKQPAPLIDIGKKEKAKVKKLKTKARSQQVVMDDSHLDLEALRQKEPAVSSRKSKLKPSKSMSDLRDNKAQRPNKKKQVSKLRRTTSESSLDLLANANHKESGKNRGEKKTKPIVTVRIETEDEQRKRPARSTKQVDLKVLRTQFTESHLASDKKQQRNHEKTNIANDSQKRNARQGSKAQPDGQILLHQGRVYKPDYSPNIDRRDDKQLYDKTEKGRGRKRSRGGSSSSMRATETDGESQDQRSKTGGATASHKTREKSKSRDKSPNTKGTPIKKSHTTRRRASAKGRDSSKDSDKEADGGKESTDTKAAVESPEITIEQRLGEKDKEAIITVITDETIPDVAGLTEGLKPPGNPELVALENLFGNVGEEQQSPEDMDPALVAKVEEQIFEKIKFYKEVQSKVREKTWFIRKKITLRAEANAYTSRFEGVSSGSGGSSFGARLKVTLNKMSRELSNYTSLMIPWEGKIRNIESYFGSVVASYFTFLRWLFWINFVMALICGVVIIMPEVMFGPDMGTVPYKSVPEEVIQEASYLKTLWNFNGYAQVSPIFYGYYSSITRYDSGFRMPFAYLLGNLMMFGYSFITILKQMESNSKNEKATDKDDNFTFAWKAFASWDYMIGNEETAKNKYKALVIAIRESVTESKESAKKISKKTKFFRFVANVLVLMVLGGSTYAIYITVDRSRKFQAMVKEQGPNSVSWGQSNEVSLVMSLVTAFCPMVFDVIAGLEDYHPRIALQWSLRRIMVLYLLNLYTLYIALYWKIQDIEKEAELANATFYENLNMSAIIPCTTLLPPLYDNTTNLTSFSEEISNHTTDPCGIPEFVPEMTCWETMVGQELIKLTVFDFVTTVGLIYITEFFRAVAIKVLNACWCWDMEIYFPAYAEFSLADNLLHLVYNQGMIWMGTLFCPGLPAFNLFKLLCLFYVRAWAVMVCNVPHERIFKAGSDNFYLMLLLFMLYVVMIPIAFAMVSIKPSRACGPYQETEYMYLIITEWVRDVFHESIFAILRYLTSPGALIPIFILLLLCIYYLSSNNEALHGTVMDLKKQLQYERTEGKKRVFNMNKAAAEAAPPPPKEKSQQALSSPQRTVEVKKVARAPSLASTVLANKYISKTKDKIKERKLAEAAEAAKSDERSADEQNETVT